LFLLFILILRFYINAIKEKKQRKNQEEQGPLQRRQLH
jgi:hypothetical protein